MERNSILKRIDRIESLVKKESAKKRLKNCNFSTFLPKHVSKRVDKFINTNEYHHEIGIDEILPIARPETVFDNKTIISEPESKTKTTRNEPFNESTVTMIREQQLEYESIKLYIDPPPPPRKSQKPSENWMAEYLQKPLKDRVIWPSKIYKFDKDFSKKTLYEQTDELMDLAADEFAEWLNSLGSGEKCSLFINKERIKNLFSIAIEGESSKALYVEPKQQNAVPHEVAMALNMPELSIEHNVARILASDGQHKVQNAKLHAFGTALPKHLKQKKTDEISVKPLKPIFPDDLRDCQVLFRGIHNWRATKTIVDHLKENSQLRKPKYLIEKGAFDEQQANTKSSLQTPHIPLYQHVIDQSSK